MADFKFPSDKPTLDKDLDRFGLMESGVQFVLSRSAGPGLAFIFIAVAALIAASASSASPAVLVIAAAAALAAYMAMNIGANDVTNNVGAAVGSKAISMAGALVIAAFFEILGAFLAGDRVVATIKGAIVNPAAVADYGQMLLIMISALLAAAFWINFSTWVNAPVSTTHSIIGSIMGAGASVAGFDSVNWQSLVEISIGWVVSPVLGAVIAVGFLWFISNRILYQQDRIAAATRWVPVLLAVMTGSFLTYLLLIVRYRYSDFALWQAFLIGICLGFASYLWFRGSVAFLIREDGGQSGSLKVLFRFPLVFSAALLSFAHGANDVSNAIGPLAAIVEAVGIRSIATNLDAPFWVMSIGALGISVGLLLFGPRLIRVVGTQITRLNPVRAYCVAMSAAVTVIIASALGFPVSSTHIAVGSVFGIGLFREWFAAHSELRKQFIDQKSGNEKSPAEPAESQLARQEKGYRYLVRRSYLLSILAAWVITVPTSGLLGASIAHVLHLVFK